MKLTYDFYENPPKVGSRRKPRLHARVITQGTSGTRELTELIREFTSLSPSDVMAALSALSNVLVLELSSGKRVHLEGLGYFQLTLAHPRITEPDEIRAESIRVKSIVFKPEKNLKERFNRVGFERAREKRHSSICTDTEIEELLHVYFSKHVFMTRKDFQRICGFTAATAYRRLNALVARRLLRKEKKGNMLFYTCEGCEPRVFT